MKVEIVGYEGSYNDQGLIAFCNVHFLREGTPGVEKRSAKDGRSYFNSGGIVRSCKVSNSAIGQLDLSRKLVSGNGEASISMDVVKFGQDSFPVITDIEYL